VSLLINDSDVQNTWVEVFKINYKILAIDNKYLEIILSKYFIFAKKLYISKNLVTTVFKIHCKILNMHLKYYLKYMYFEKLNISDD